ncbi:MAG: DUF188 domain-containing protein [Bacteroides sp.]|nr:DUF188 domain-containing protein [Prevotella sp.]MCM1408328.1 DUF188 domain-containing protein [Treponema brennaborense]MCM1470440.1 DUF188 domain-containing protein [Bacteroides sp.]
MSYPFLLWVDADSCPVQVRDLIIRFSNRLQVQTVFVANRLIPLKKNALAQMVITSSAKDSADDYIAEHAEKKDIVVTRDIPLAARLVEKQITVLNDRGIIFTPENIKERLSMRNFSLMLIEQGITPQKTSTLSKKEINAFANCLDRELQKRIKKHTNGSP